MEAIENYGCDKGIKDYFWTTVKKEYPALASLLHKIKVYRHNSHHLLLNQQTNDRLQEFLQEDLPSDIPKDERYYCLQQKILEDLITNIQIELNQLS